MREIFANLRVLATIRRIAKAMERANELEANRQGLEFPVVMPSHTSARRPVISRPTVEDWNRRAAGVPPVGSDG